MSVCDRDKGPLGSAWALHPYEPHEQRGVAPAFKGWDKKERKKTDNPREGWEDGTPPPHRDF